MKGPFVLLAAMLLASASAIAKSPKSPAPPPPPTASIVPVAVAEPLPSEDAAIIVTIRHMSGEKEVYSGEVDTMDLVFDSTGRLQVVHLILITNGEKDTHRWYEVPNLASFSYRFLNVAGKGKVRLRQLQPIGKDDGSKVEPYQSLTQKDFR